LIDNLHLCNNTNTTTIGILCFFLEHFRSAAQHSPASKSFLSSVACKPIWNARGHASGINATKPPGAA
jgi:hypothetical protein